MTWPKTECSYETYFSGPVQLPRMLCVAFFFFRGSVCSRSRQTPWIIYECDSLIDGKISQFSPTRKFPFVVEVVCILSLPTMRHIFLSIVKVHCEFLIFFNEKTETCCCSVERLKKASEVNDNIITSFIHDFHNLSRLLSLQWTNHFFAHRKNKAKSRSAREKNPSLTSSSQHNSDDFFVYVTKLGKMTNVLSPSAR